MPGKARPAAEDSGAPDEPRGPHLPQAMLEQGELYRSLFAALAEGVMLLDASGTILACNDSMGRLLAVPADELVGRPYLAAGYAAFRADGTPMPDREHPATIALDTGRASADVLVGLRRHDGEFLWTSINTQPLFHHGEARPYAVVKSFFDVTERKRAEDALRVLAEASVLLASSIDYRTTLENVARLATRTLADWCAVDLLEGERTIRRVAVSHPEPDMVALAHRLWDRYPPDFDAPHGAPHVMRTGQPEVYWDIGDELLQQGALDDEHLALLRELRLRSALIVPLSAGQRTLGAMTLVTSDSGRRFAAHDLDLAIELGRRCAQAVENARLYAAAQQELVERRRAEQALRRSEESLRLSLAASTTGVWTRDLQNGDRVEWSPELERVFGLPVGAFGGTHDHWLAFVHPDDRERVVHVVQEAIDTGREYEVEFRFLHTSGETRWMSGRGRAFYDVHGRVQSLAGTGTDVTDRKRAEEELRRHRERLEELVQERTEALRRSHERLRLAERMSAIGTLAAGLGHDMGNLLLPIRVRLEILRSKLSQADVHEDLDAIHQATEYLTQLSRGLRLLSLDPEQGGSSESTALPQWYADVEAIFRNVLPRRVELTVDLAPDLPLIRGARHQLTQAVFNLVSNAGDALRERGEGNVRIAAVAAAGGRQVEISVRDDGPGMPADVQQRAFEPFFTTKTRRFSTGMGLSLVHGIVDALGGSVRLWSEPARGTEIVMLLPAVEQPAPQRVPPTVHALVSLADPRQRSLARMMLEGLGAAVTEREATAVAVVDAPNTDVPLGTVWVTGRATAASLHTFLGDDARRRVLLLGELPTSSPGDPRVITLAAAPRPAVLRATLTSLVSDLAKHPHGV